VANSISSCFRDIVPLAYWGYEFDLSGSRDVIGHVTVGFPIPISNFLLAVFRNQVSISNGLRDIQWQNVIHTILTMHRKKVLEKQTDPKLKTTLQLNGIEQHF